MTKRKFVIGEKWGFLTVTGYVKAKRNGEKRLRSYYELTCDCGNKIIRRPCITNNSTNSCGCQPKGSWKGVGKVSGTFYHRLKTNAKVRGLAVEVDVGYLAALFEKQNGLCAISDLPIELNRDTTGTNTASVDRINSSKGYVKGNVWWVHKDINQMKMDFTLPEFLKLCQAVTSNSNGSTGKLSS